MTFNANTNWTADSRVPASLDELRNNPPQIVWSKVPSRSCLFGKDDVWSYASPAIDALNAIQNEYFLKLDAIDNEHGAEAYMAAARQFFEEQQSVSDLVEQIEAQRKVAA